MKLNLGCGGYYKKGYLNVDAHNSIIADKKIEATDLQFEDNSFDEVFISQVIEHLGVVRSIFSFSEIYRVLKPHGKLIIETPDISKSFKIYLDGNIEDKKNILPWIYGIDLPGMIHKFCFPDDYLEMILNDMGFININKQFIEKDKYEPTLKIICEKPENYQTTQFITHYRKKILNMDLIDLDDQIVSMEKEDLIKKFTKFLIKKDFSKLTDLYHECVIISPVLTKIFFQEIKNSKYFEYENIDGIIKKIKVLEDQNIIQYLFNKIMETEGFEGKQDELFRLILKKGKELIKNNSKIDIKYLNIEKIDIFSYKLLMLKSYQYFQIASKEFILSNFEEAIKFFKKSEKLYRDQILTYWNLGRLYNNINEFEKSKNNYQKALSLLNSIDYKEKTNVIKKQLEKEICKISDNRYEEPIVSIKDI